MQLLCFISCEKTCQKCGEEFNQVLCVRYCGIFMRRKTVRKVKSRLKKAYINGLSRLKLSIYSEPVTVWRNQDLHPRKVSPICAVRKILQNTGSDILLICFICKAQDKGNAPVGCKPCHCEDGRWGRLSRRPNNGHGGWIKGPMFHPFASNRQQFRTYG